MGAGHLKIFTPSGSYICEAEKSHETGPQDSYYYLSASQSKKQIFLTSE